MALSFSCDHCGKSFSVSDSLAGKRGRCKQCGHIFQIPGPAERARPAAADRPAPGGVKTSAAQPSPRPKPRPANQPAAVPPPREHDPYGLDDVFSEPKRPAGEDAEGESLLPRAVGLKSPQPAEKKKKKRKKRRDEESLAERLKTPQGIVMLLCLGYFAVTLLYGLVNPLGMLLFVGGLVLLGMILGVVGGFLGLVVVFSESVVCGLLYLFMPFYALYYLISRWEDMKKPFVTSLLGSICIWCSVPFLPAVTNNLKMQPASSGLEIPDDPPGTYSIVVRGLPSKEAGDAVQRRLAEIQRELGTAGSFSMNGRGAGETRYFNYSPMADLTELRSKIDFGQVEASSNHRIEVRFTGLPGFAETDHGAPEDSSASATLPPMEPAEGAGDPYTRGELIDEPELRRSPEEQFRDVGPKGSVLIGVRVSYVDAFQMRIASVQPIYRLGDKLLAGKRYGRAKGPQIEAVAKPGYVVGTLKTHTGLMVDGFALVFVRLVEGQMDRNDSYESLWLGSPTGGQPSDIDCKGQVAVGLEGRARNEIFELGLILLNP